MNDIENKQKMKKNTTIMLWGKKKATIEQMGDTFVKTTPKRAVKASKTNKIKSQRDYFDPNISYTVDDIDFLEEQMEKLNEQYEEQNFESLNNPDIQKYYDIKNIDKLDDDEKDAIMYKLVDKIERSIDILKDYKEDTNGRGFKKVGSDSGDEDFVTKFLKKDKKETKKAVKAIKPKQETKKRVEKGSEEAKEKMAKLTAIRSANKLEKDKIKNAEKESKRDQKETKKKPYYYTGVPPKGYRKATEDEALSNDMYSEFGENVIDASKLKYYEKYNILLSADKTPSQINITLNAFKKRVNGIYEDIEILESQSRSAKSGSEIDKLEDKISRKKDLIKNYLKTEEGKRLTEKLTKLKDTDYSKGIETKIAQKERELKDIKKIYRYYQKILEQKTGIKQELLTEFKKKEKPIHTPPPPKEVVKKTPIEEFLSSKEEPKKETYRFYNKDGRLEIPKKYFDEKMVLHSKYAEKLHKKDVLLHPEHYDETDTNKYFYTRIGGKGIGTYDLQKLLKQSYNSNLANVDDYIVDNEISNPTTQVYRNKNTDKIYVVHRGTEGSKDWLNNFVYGLSPSMYKYTNRYKNAKATQDKAIEKYKGYDIDVLGHSQGAKIAEIASKDNKNVKNVITYNRPQGLIESLYKKPKNLYDIKTSFDPVSPLLAYQDNTVIIPSKSYNVVHEHQPDRLLDVADRVIGTGLINERLLKEQGHNMIMAMRNAQGGTMYRSMGQGFMHNNVEHYTPSEALLKNTNLITHHALNTIKEHKDLAKQAKTTLKNTVKMNKASLKQSLKGSQEMKDRMAKLRAMKKK